MSRSENSSRKASYDRRRHRRYPLRAVVGRLASAARPKITVLDMSLTGLAFETHQQLRTGSEKKLRLLGKDQTVSLSVEIRGCQLVRTEEGPYGDSLPVYRAGADFRAALARQAGSLLRFIAGHAQIQITPPISLRLDLPADESYIAAGGATLHLLSAAHLEIETTVDLTLGDPVSIVAEDSQLYLSATTQVVGLGPKGTSPGRKIDLELPDSQRDAKAVLRQFIRSELE